MPFPVDSWTEDNKLTETEALALQRYFRALHMDGATQVELAEQFAISQAMVSRILAHDSEILYRPTRGTIRKMSSAAGVPFQELIGGTQDAGRFEAEDNLKPRGRALDILSRVYDDNFLRAALKKTPIPGSESWTHEQWHDHLTELRKAWKAGLLTLPGIPSPVELKKSSR